MPAIPPGLRPDLREAMVVLECRDCPDLADDEQAHVRIMAVWPVPERGVVCVEGWRHWPDDPDIRHVRLHVRQSALPGHGDEVIR